MPLFGPVGIPGPPVMAETGLLSPCGGCGGGGTIGLTFGEPNGIPFGPILT